MSDKIYLDSLDGKIIQCLLEDNKTRDQICEFFGFKKYNINYSLPYPNNIKRTNVYHRNVEQYKRRTTIFDHLYKLEKRGMVLRIKKLTGARGRPPILWKLNKKKFKFFVEDTHIIVEKKRKMIKISKIV